MEIQIVENIREKLQVIIQCKQVDSEVLRLKTHIEAFDARLQAKREKEWCFVEIAEVLYFETVENKTFLYTEREVMEVRQKLYELEMMLSEKDFIRTSKSQIININKVKTLQPELNRTILATMCNGERLYISRKYVQALKKLLAV